MFDLTGSPLPHIDAARIDAAAAALASVGAGLDDAGRLDALRSLEGLKAACAAAQVKV